MGAVVSDVAGALDGSQTEKTLGTCIKGLDLSNGELLKGVMPCYQIFKKSSGYSVEIGLERVG